MLITKIVKIKNNVKIFFDNKDSLTIRYDIFVKHGLRKGDEINEEIISSLLVQNDNFTVKETAFRLLTRRPHSKKELEKKLLARNFNREIIYSVTNDLENNHYLNDEKFSQDFVQEKQKKKHLGKNQIKAKLKEKGIPDEIINENLNKITDSEEFESAMIIARKKLSQLKNMEDLKKKKQRIYSFLQLKGYNFEIIRKVTENLLKPESFNGL
jgi:regulatory protein